jgi:hypothetical protein
MDELLAFLTPDRVAMLMWMFSAAVQSLPSPNGNKLYSFVYKFFHLMAANIREAAKKPPGRPQLEVEREAEIAGLKERLASFTAVRTAVGSGLKG